MEKVCDDHAPVIITRKNARSVVMIFLEDYQALEETAYLLRSPKNARRLLEAIAALEAGRGTERTLLEFSAFSPSTSGKSICIGNVPTGKSSNVSRCFSERASALRLRALESPSRSSLACLGTGHGASLMRIGWSIKLRPMRCSSLSCATTTDFSTPNAGHSALYTSLLREYGAAQSA